MCAGCEENNDSDGHIAHSYHSAEAQAADVVAHLKCIVLSNGKSKCRQLPGIAYLDFSYLRMDCDGIVSPLLS